MTGVFRTLTTAGKRVGPLDVYFGGLSDEALSDAEDVFFAGLQLSNGTFKTTRVHRLDDVNDLLIELLPSRVEQNAGRPLDIMDVAVSSGVSTAEWVKHLNRERLPHQMVAGDLSVTGTLLTVGQRVGVLWQHDGKALVVQIGNRSVYLTRGNRASRFLDPPLRRIYRRLNGCRAPFESAPRRALPVVRTVGLVSRRLGATADSLGQLSAGGIALVQDDLTLRGRFDERFDVIRAANILNREYFDDETLGQIASNLFARLRDTGLLVVCRTRNEDHVTEASVFRLENDTARIVQRLNGGVEVEPVLRSASAASSDAVPTTAPSPPH